MPESSTLKLRLLGAFAIEASAERPAAPAIRSRKARALLAYLAMKPDWRAGREELATLLWGDTPDAQARHSLRQCLVSLRQDLHRTAPDLLDIDRETIELRAQGLMVDARELLSIAACRTPAARAAYLARGPFLADLALDIEEFDAWRRHEQERLSDAAARVFETLAADADAAGDGERAIAAAERLVALDPTREDRQRVALKIVARHRGRAAALGRARQIKELLRSELAAAPEAATRALIDSIRNGAIAPVQVEKPLAVPDAAAPPVAIAAPASALVPADDAQPAPIPATPHWRRRPVAAALATMAAVSIGTVAVFAAGVSIPWARLPFAAQTPPGSAIAAAGALPSPPDAPRGAADLPSARMRTHNLTADPTHSGDLRIVSERTADLYGDRDIGAAGAELGVGYAVIGRVQQSDDGLRADVQLVDAATRMTLWSDHVRREAGDAGRLADEVALGLTHALVVNMTYARVRRLHQEPGQPPPIADLMLRARAYEMRGHSRDNVVAALSLYEDVLRR